MIGNTQKTKVLSDSYLTWIFLHLYVLPSITIRSVQSTNIFCVLFSKKEDLSNDWQYTKNQSVVRFVSLCEG